MILIQYGSKILINTGKNTPIIDSNDEKRITSQTKIDEIVLHPMHGAPPPTPFTVNYFAKKNLGGKGGYSLPPLDGESPKIFLKKWVEKG